MPNMKEISTVVLEEKRLEKIVDNEDKDADEDADEDNDAGPCQ